MSHCSKFEIKFKDKQLLFKAMRNLDMNPENKIWESYESTIGKLIGLNGTVIGKLLTGRYDSINIFFIEEDGVLIPYTESHKLSPVQLEARGKKIINMIQSEYVKCAVEKFQHSITLSGQSIKLTSQVSKNEIMYTLEIGDWGKKLIIILDNQGVINEQVVGVEGRSCADLTSIFEGLTAQAIQREWTHEYNEVIEDNIIQVLNLR